MPELDLESVLRDLPRPAFRKALRESMQPQTVTPYIVLGGEPEPLVDWLKSVFAAEELLRAPGSAGGVHVELRIGDSKIMIGGGGAVERRPMPTALHYYVSDVDAMYQRAVGAGATSLMPPRDQEYGDRDCALKDLAGNEWYIATSRGAHYKPEAMRNVTMYLHPFGVDQLLAFIQRAFGAETLERSTSPQGVVGHAKVKIGNSIVEMGEAHAQWKPMPSMIHCQVDDTDASYQRAIAEGAKPVMPPKNQPYGARMAGVEDPAGNQWFLSGPVRSS